MAESVDALVSNTSAARRAGSTPAPGTRRRLRAMLGAFFACTNFLTPVSYADSP